MNSDVIIFQIECIILVSGAMAALAGGAPAAQKASKAKVVEKVVKVTDEEQEQRLIVCTSHSYNSHKAVAIWIPLFYK